MNGVNGVNGVTASQQPHALAAAIAQEIVQGGPMTFARFMERALYDPTLGYYAGGGAGREPLGWAGDYITSGDLHPLWGWTLARQLHQMWQLLGQPPRFDVLEPGAGRGLLARDVWRYARERAPEWAATLRYTLVDRASATAPLRLAREQRLRGELARIGAPPDATRWLDALPSDEPLVGCVVSNELVDALPVHLLEVRAGALYEVYVALDPARGVLAERLDAPFSPAVAAYLDTYAIPWRRFPDGWRCEVCLAAAEWLRAATTPLQRGFVLTIDYGDTARMLYTPARRHGTLAAYRQQTLSDHVLTHPGRQDLTAHVNFSALIAAGRASGLRLAGLTTQTDLLQRLGIRAEADALAARLYPAAIRERHTDRGQADYLRMRSLQSAVANLLNPRGLGGFHVLLQQRGVPGAARALLGLQPQPADAAPQTTARW